MPLETKKISDYEIEITETVQTTEVKKTVYDRAFIETQLASIQKQRDEFVALRDAEIAKCQSIIDEMDALDIASREDIVEPITPTPEELPGDTEVI